MSTWGQIPVGESIFTIFLFIYVIFGQIPFVQNIVDMFMSRFISTDMVGGFARLSRIYGNVLLLPAVVFFLISVTSIMRKTISRGRRLLYMLAGIGIPLCIILLAVAGGNLPSMRTHYALPLATAFMLFFLIEKYKKKAATVVACLALLVAAYQAQISAQLFYSDQMRYNEDVRLAYEFNNLIIREQPGNRKLPVALAGHYHVGSRFHANFLDGDIELIGNYAFGVGGSIHQLIRGGTPINQSTYGALKFMKSLGINYDMPNDSQLEQALKEAATIPPYPDPGCVKRTRDFIVVRVSENLD
jgi:hypothetical protein